MEPSGRGSRQATEFSFHSPRGEGRATAGCLAGVGLLLLGFTAAAVLLARLFSREGGWEDLYRMGSFLGIPGTILLFQAIWQRTRPGRVTPHEDVSARPWTRFPWNPAGARDETGERATAFLLRSLWLALFVAAAALFAWFFSRLTFLVLLVLPVVAVAVLLRALYLLARFRRFGGARFLFDRFPFLLGESLEGRVVVRVPLPPADRLRLRLRCLREVQIHSGKDSRDAVTQVWSEERRPRAEDVSADGRELRVRFELPASAPPTRFSSPYPDYWELLLSADLPGVDYGAVFLVPVYAPSAR